MSVFSLPRRHRFAYRKYKETARLLIKSRLEFFNAHYGLTYSRVAVKNHKRLWGSCSARGNLNFNYRLIFLPPELADYIIVHELCHLKELNHSPRFWALVAETFPHYKKMRASLRTRIL